MAFGIDNLKAQLQDAEQELEVAKAHVYRCDGAIQLLKLQIAEAEKPENDDTPASE